MDSTGIAVGFAVSFVAGIASTVFMAWASTKVKDIPEWNPVMWLLATVFGHGIEYVYRDQQHAMRAILRDLDNTKWVKIYTFRGRSFVESSACDADFPFTIEQTKTPVTLIVADPLEKRKYEATENPIKERAEETRTPLYRKTLVHTLDCIADWKSKRSDFECKLHSNFAVFRLIIFHNRMYLGFFRKGKLGQGLRMLRIKPRTTVYEGFLRFFEKELKRASDFRTYPE